jgi:SAM-dependent methyltransferase
MLNLRKMFVEHIYADHNKSREASLALKKMLSKYDPLTDDGLNIGAGNTFFGKHIQNLELEPGDNVDLVGSVMHIPANDESFDFIISQEVLEHVENPFVAMREINRVLRYNGMGYIQLPFIIGYHPCPNDFYRFSHQGIAYLVESAGFKILEIGQTVGSASGFYRILVEFIAVLFSCLWERLYIPTKAFAALLFFPLKYLDLIMNTSKQSKRIAGGFFVVFKKVQ